MRATFIPPAMTGIGISPACSMASHAWVIPRSVDRMPVIKASRPISLVQAGAFQAAMIKKTNSIVKSHIKRGPPIMNNSNIIFCFICFHKITFASQVIKSQNRSARCKIRLLAFQVTLPCKILSRIAYF